MNYGFYGKLPCKGDFILKGLPADFITPLDQWLQQGIALSRERLAERWEQLYMVSPIWHFYFPKGVCGDEGWVGSMMPSVDKANRLFPFVVACQVNHRLTVEQLGQQAIQQWYMEMSGWLLSVLELESCDTEALYRELISIPCPPMESDRESTAETGYFVRTQSTLDGHGFIPLANQITGSLLSGAIFWRFHEESREPAILLGSFGLPTTEQYVALYDERWDDHHWRSPISLWETKADDEEWDDKTVPYYSSHTR